MDIDALGVMGHSAGGGSTAALVDVDTRFKAAIPMGGTGPISRDVPTLDHGRSCDALWKASLFGPSIRPCQMLRWPRSEVLVIWPFRIFATLILAFW